MCPTLGSFTSRRDGRISHTRFPAPASSSPNHACCYGARVSVEGVSCSMVIPSSWMSMGRSLCEDRVHGTVSISLWACFSLLAEPTIRSSLSNLCRALGFQCASHKYEREKSERKEGEEDMWTTGPYQTSLLLFLLDIAHRQKLLWYELRR